MMRSSDSKTQGRVEAVNSETPLENGLPPKEDEDEAVRELATRVVEDVVKRASETVRERSAVHPSPTPKNRGYNLQRLPIIQIDTVQSPPSSPVDWTPPNESDEVEEPAVHESEIQLDLDVAEQEPENSEEDLKEHLKSYVEDILSQAMVLAEKKLQFAGLPDEDEEEDEEQSSQPVQSPSEPAEEPEKEIDDSEIRAVAEKVVEEVISKASETVAERLENGISADLSFPGLPTFQIDTVTSAPPSPEVEEEMPQPKKKWTFKVDDTDTESEKDILQPDEDIQPEESKLKLIKFDDAPEEVKEAATSIVKEIVGKAVAMVEEKSAPTAPFNFEDVELMKNSGPWYVRAREAFIRLLRTACFCTPRRTDS